MKITCPVCVHRCSLEEGQRGLCGARKNVEGRIVCVNYGQAASLALDPVEKKPLKMFRPGKLVLSVGSYGCNLRCPFCQNHEISMSHDLETVFITPEELAAKALACKRAGNTGVAFTYNEPLVGWEYVRDTARLVKEKGMDNVLVTNGTACLWVLEELLPFVDAMNIDLKGFTKEYYKRLGGDLEAVKSFIARAVRDCHVELTTLIVPGENDRTEEMEAEAKWIASLGRDIPLHVTRFFPRYRMADREATDVGRVYELAETAGKYLDYVFVGNC